MSRIVPIAWGTLCLACLPCIAHAQADNQRVVLEDAFQRNALGEGWNTNNGSWQVADGVLRAKELPADQHAAAARRTLETKDATYELRFRFVNQGKAFHFGFDPARGELKKKGHLFSVIVTPTSWKIMKHVDKDRREEDPNETLATEATEFKTGQWYALKLVTSGTEVKATIDGKQPLQATHPTFGVKKPTLVFRCIGDGVEIDDLRVTVAK
ncbi:MAG: hypothetical protein KDB14_21965 [Planctomycetales bacterium]|nr:hypothetical protein [Planctomycetales bacterium]